MTCPCPRPRDLTDDAVREYLTTPGLLGSAGIATLWHIVEWRRCRHTSPQIRGPGQPDACDAGTRCHLQDGHEGRHRSPGHASSWWFADPERLSGGRGIVDHPGDPQPWPVPCWVTTAAEAERWRPNVAPRTLPSSISVGYVDDGSGPRVTSVDARDAAGRVIPGSRGWAAIAEAYRNRDSDPARWRAEYQQIVDEVAAENAALADRGIVLDTDPRTVVRRTASIGGEEVPIARTRREAMEDALINGEVFYERPATPPPGRPWLQDTARALDPDRPWSRLTIDLHGLGRLVSELQPNVSHRHVERVAQERAFEAFRRHGGALMSDGVPMVAESVRTAIDPFCRCVTWQPPTPAQRFEEMVTMNGETIRVPVPGPSPVRLRGAGSTRDLRQDVPAAITAALGEEVVDVFVQPNVEVNPIALDPAAVAEAVRRHVTGHGRPMAGVAEGLARLAQVEAEVREGRAVPPPAPPRRVIVRPDQLRAIAAWVQAVASWQPPSPADHAREALTALADLSGLTRLGSWWRSRQAARDRVRNRTHVTNINRALVTGQLGAGTSGLPIDEDDA